jgi:hypothetical protein
MKLKVPGVAGALPDKAPENELIDNQVGKVPDVPALMLYEIFGSQEQSSLALTV